MQEKRFDTAIFFTDDAKITESVIETLGMVHVLWCKKLPNRGSAERSIFEPAEYEGRYVLTPGKPGAVTNTVEVLSDWALAEPIGIQLFLLVPGLFPVLPHYAETLRAYLLRLCACGDGWEKIRYLPEALLERIGHVPLVVPTVNAMAAKAA